MTAAHARPIRGRPGPDLSLPRFGYRAKSHAYTMYFDPLATILAVPEGFVPCGGARERRNRRLRGISVPAATFNAISAMNLNGGDHDAVSQSFRMSRLRGACRRCGGRSYGLRRHEFRRGVVDQFGRLVGRRLLSGVRRVASSVAGVRSAGRGAARAHAPLCARLDRRRCLG